MRWPSLGATPRRLARAVARRARTHARASTRGIAHREHRRQTSVDDDDDDDGAAAVVRRTFVVDPVRSSSVE